MFKIYLYGLKKRLVWVFQKKEERDNDIETGLKEGGGMKIEIYSASIRDARSIRF